MEQWFKLTNLSHTDRTNKETTAEWPNLCSGLSIITNRVVSGLAVLDEGFNGDPFVKLSWEPSA